MTRAEKVAKAQGLRAEGWLLREIADYMDVAIQTVNAWLKDPDGSRLRARKDGYRGSCIDCGGPTDGSNGPDATPLRCLRCNGFHQAERQRETWEPHRRAVEAAWAEGLTCAEMCERFNWTGPHAKTMVSKLRGRGYNLPHRRTPEQIARITAGSAVSLAKARAAAMAARRVAA